MDDKAFQAAQLETQVTATRDHTRWNYETLLDLIEGPLLSQKRLEEAIKVSKFIKRLMSFFHPFAHRFSDLKRVKVVFFPYSVCSLRSLIWFFLSV